MTQQPAYKLSVESLIKSGRANGIQSAKRLQEISRLEELNNALFDLARFAQKFCKDRGGSWSEFETKVNEAIAKCGVT